MSGSGKWADLRLRVLSGAVVLAIGIAAIWTGGAALKLLAIVSCGLMIWELTRLMLAAAQPSRAYLAPGLGGIAAVGLALLLFRHGAYWNALLLAPSAIGLLMLRRDRMIFAAYAFAVMLAAYAFVAFREGYGAGFVLWFVLVVFVSDVMGYFGGRSLGGPKFWPRVSPKKTWSGTIAGWLGAALVGLAAVIWAAQPGFIILFSAVTAFAAQMGDIAESAIKRRAGVKDSSQLIPGHGGLLDRFDALIGAAVFLLLCSFAQLPVPVFGG